MLEEGFWGYGYRRRTPRLFSEHNAMGVQASVYNVKANAWIAPSEAVDDIEEGQEWGEENARPTLKLSLANLELLASELEEGSLAIAVPAPMMKIMNRSAGRAGLNRS